MTTDHVHLIHGEDDPSRWEAERCVFRLNWLCPMHVGEERISNGVGLSKWQERSNGINGWRWYQMGRVGLPLANYESNLDFHFGYYVTVLSPVKVWMRVGLMCLMVWPHNGSDKLCLTHYMSLWCIMHQFKLVNPICITLQNLLVRLTGLSGTSDKFEPSRP